MVFKRHLPRIAILIIAIACSWMKVEPVAAQNYQFKVPSMDVDITLLDDARATIRYRIEFSNMAGAHPIDIVDIGLPHGRYQVSAMSASVNGRQVGPIKPSTYIATGVEVPLNEMQIGPGEYGTLEFTATMPDMVYQDTSNKEWASFQFVPTWFDPQLNISETNLRLAVHFPVGVKPEDVRYQREETKYQTVVLTGKEPSVHAAALWSYPLWRLSDANPKIGVSFPKSVMKRVVTMNAFQLLVKWFVERPRVRMAWGGAVILMFAFTFMRFTHATGFVLLLILGAVLVMVMFISPPLQLMALPISALFLFLNERMLGRRRSKYLPALATVEGGGTRRGLTAPQAAVLLELPLNRVLTLVIFGLIKKRVVEMTQADPLTVKVAGEYQEPAGKRRMKAGASGTILHEYEQPFIDALKYQSKPVKELDFNVALKNLIEQTAKAMKGFDADQTRDYYRKIIARAWKEAEAIGELPERDKVVDRVFDWMVLDGEWGRRFDNWDRTGRPYRPTWTRDHRTTTWSTGSSSSGAGSSQSSPAPTTQPGGTTSFGEVASSFAGWMENTSANLASTIQPASFVGTSPKGFVDLSGVDRVTADLFQALAESASKGGGGGGGGCACACAGCACACACAGGGR